MIPHLDELADRFAAAALGHVAREYPHVQVHVMSGPEDPFVPSKRHPIFFGSYDWHSCVHGHWLLATLLRLYPERPFAGEIRAHLAQAFTPQKVAGEVAYLADPAHRGFERPYGWAWLLALAAELGRHDAPWAEALGDLEGLIVERFEAWLPIADYPNRNGSHGNTAFALLLSLEYARTSGKAGLEALIIETARRWHSNDVAVPDLEPSGDDFLSPTLIEAALMRSVLEPPAFADWFAAFLPDAPQNLARPARVSDRSDGKIAHLDGLNISRAWCWRRLDLPGSEAAAERLLGASLPHVTGDYAGEHWLASFALLALL